MTIQQRIDGLKAAIEHQKEMRDWVLEESWSVNDQDAQALAKEHDRLIEMYEKLLAALED